MKKPPTRLQSLASHRNWTQMGIKAMRQTLIHKVAPYWKIDVQPLVKALDQLSSEIDIEWQLRREIEK